jgi:DNA polymerase-3 subunit beta
MKTSIDVSSFSGPWASVVQVAPTKTPKPILMKVLFRAGLGADPDIAELIATDLQITVTTRVPCVDTMEPGECMLDPVKFGKILKGTLDPDLFIEADDQGIQVKELRSSFRLGSEDPVTFPTKTQDQIEADAAVSVVIGKLKPSQLKRLIDRTIIATDANSTKYALGGALVECVGGHISFVAADGRRVARQTEEADEGLESLPSNVEGTVIPIAAMKALLRTFGDSTDEELITVTIRPKQAVVFSSAWSTVDARVLEGRFPRYQDAFPARHAHAVVFHAGELRRVVERSMIVTSEETRAVDFQFRPGTTSHPGTLSLVTETSEGACDVQIPIEYGGDPMDMLIDPSYLVDMLKVVDRKDHVVFRMTSEKVAGLIEVSDNYKYLFAPMTRDVVVANNEKDLAAKGKAKTPPAPKPVPAEEPDDDDNLIYPGGPPDEVVPADPKPAKPKTPRKPKAKAESAA